MYIKEKYSWIKHLDFIVIDSFAMISSFFVSYYYKFGSFNWCQKDEWKILFLIVIFNTLFITLVENPYSNILKIKFYDYIIRGFILSFSSLLSISFFFYIFKVGALFSREMILETYTIHFVLGTILKYLWKNHLTLKKPRDLIPLYVVCDENKIDEVKESILSADLSNYEIVGISNKNDFTQDVLNKKAREVLISKNPVSINTDIYEILIQNGIKIHVNIENIIGTQTEQQYITNLGVYKTLSIDVHEFTAGQLVYLGFKRIFDILCGLIGLIILIPLSIIIKIITLMSGDKDSIFYKQKRIGLNGKHIEIYKFRSMVSNADQVLEEMLKNEYYQSEWKENQKIENDPRITKIGNFLRKTSLDELPQLLNVLKGEMSLVGPRPLVEGELEAHDGLMLYNHVKPGITGWWGCNGRSNTSYRERLELEYYYVKNCSLYLDILCIVRTVFAVLNRKGVK